MPVAGPNTYLGAQYRRLVARRGKKKAAVAVGHTMLVIAYYLLTRQTGLRRPRPDLLRPA